VATPATPRKGAKKWTEARDVAADKRAGIKEGSPRDNALDKKRGVPVRKGK
jgi:hypothetical protein